MERFVVPAAASIVVGLLLGAAAVFGGTVWLQEDTMPSVAPADDSTALLNRVEYGQRT